MRKVSLLCGLLLLAGCGEEASSPSSPPSSAPVGPQGPCGFELDVAVEWTYGHEGGSPYVDPEGGFLFSMLSW